MDELKATVASNLIRLRTGAGMTQAELGEKLNYSDKSISKWERAEALPDACVLLQMGGLFGVSVDYLLHSHDTWQAPESGYEESYGGGYSSGAVMGLAVAGIWTLAVAAFVVLWLLGSVVWSIFVYAVPVSLITLLVLNSVWHGGRGNLWIVMALVLSVICCIYVALRAWNPWQVFIIAAPSELVVFFSFRIKKRRKIRDSTDRRET